MTGWVMVQPPSGDDYWCANQSLNPWQVDLGEDGRLKLAKVDERQRRRDALPFPFGDPDDTAARFGRRVALRVADTWLIGLDFGEFGGGLWTTTEKGGNAHQLGKENIREIVGIGSKIFALGGEPSLRKGVVLEIAVGAGGAVEARKGAVLRGYPVAATRRGDSVVVVTTDEVLLLAVDGSIKEILRFDLGSLYPSSVVGLECGALYVGMRHHVLRLALQNGSWAPEWFAPQDCRRFRVDGEHCVCLR